MPHTWLCLGHRDSLRGLLHRSTTDRRRTFRWAIIRLFPWRSCRIRASWVFGGTRLRASFSVGERALVAVLATLRPFPEMTIRRVPQITIFALRAFAFYVELANFLLFCGCSAWRTFWSLSVARFLLWARLSFSALSFLHGIVRECTRLTSGAIAVGEPRSANSIWAPRAILPPWFFSSGSGGEGFALQLEPFV